MKKKVFFIISAILQIILSIVIILNADQIVQQQVEQLTSASTSETLSSTIKMLQNKGAQIAIVESVAIVILNIFVIITAIKNKILPRKGLMIACTVICFFLSNHTLINLLCVIGLIVLICSQRKNPEDFPPEKKPIPKIEYKKSTTKEKIGAIVLAVIYFSQFALDRIMPENLPTAAKIGIIVGYYVTTFLAAIICFRHKLKQDIILLKNNFGSYMRFVMPKYGLALLMLMVTNVICLRLTNQSTSVNQSHINSMPLWFTAPLAIIWAPIVEESVFRGILRRFIKNDIAFIIVSAILFGAIHTLSEATLLNAIIMTIPYATLGGFLAYMYAKSENITTNIFAHSLQNTIATVIGALTTFIIFTI